MSEAEKQNELAPAGDAPKYEASADVNAPKGSLTGALLVAISLVTGFIAGQRMSESERQKSLGPGAITPLPEPRAGDKRREMTPVGAAPPPRADADAQRPKHTRLGTSLVVISLVAAFAGGIGFLVTYWTGGNNILLGSMLALFFGAMGIALVIWSHLLSSHVEVTEPREPLEAPTPELAGALEDFCKGGREIQRRGLLKWAAAAGVGTVAAMWISMLRSFSLSPDASLYSRIWKRGQRLVTVDGKPISADALQPGSIAVVFPEDSIGDERSQTILIRVRKDLLELPRRRADWAPMGNLAYSRVCTHAGCSVGMYEATTHLLMCPCHQSTFNVLDGAQPTGGPAARALPQLPLYTDSQGFLRAAGGFSEPPGPGFWGLT